MGISYEHAMSSAWVDFVQSWLYSCH